MYADGYVSSTSGSKKIGIAISANDREHLDKLNKSLNSNYPIHSYFSDKGYCNNTKYSRVIITSDQMYSDLINQGVLEHKSMILQPPQNVPENLIKHFIRGYLDGDGTITNNGNSYYVGFVGTKEFLMWLNDVLNNNGMHINIRLEKRWDECDIFSYKVHGENAYNLLRFIYDDATIFLNRKFDKGKEAITYFSRLYQ